MNRIAGLLITCITVLYSCRQEPRERSAAPVEELKLIEVLTDVRILEGAYAVTYQSTTRSDLSSYYAQIFARHGLTQAEFRDGMLYYAFDPEQMLYIEDAVLERLNSMIANERAATPEVPN